jgi:Ca-activated chloride channel family protein
MFRFGNPYILFLILIVPVLYAGYIFYRINHKSRLKKFGNPQLINQLMPLYSGFRSTLKFTLLMVAISFLIIALARPQFGSKLREVKQKGIEMIIALDVSNSMLATDISPTRLDRAKQAINSLVGKMHDDQIGMIVFAGDAYTQLPITADYISAKLFLLNINTDMVSRQGTAIGQAINLGMNSFTQSESASKAIVIISDGENHEGDAIEAAKTANDKGIKIYTIGIGSTEGSLIPRPDGKGYVTDRQGNPVTTRMNPDMLNQIAAAGGGKFVQATTNNVGLHDLYSDLKKLEKAEIQKQVYSEYDDQFGYFVAAALLLILAEILILERKNKWLSDIKIFSKL